MRLILLVTLFVTALVALSRKHYVEFALLLFFCGLMAAYIARMLFWL
jgi:hypothetical protein